MDYNNFFLRPQRKYVVRRGCLYLAFGIPACLLFLRLLGLFIRFMNEVGIY